MRLSARGCAALIGLVSWLAAGCSDPGDDAPGSDVGTGDGGECIPSCQGKYCGDDGCGGTCGDCGGVDDGNWCTDTACVEGKCAYVPSDKPCSGGAGRCVAGQCCLPVCELLGGGARECGDDGCGGTCGTCPGSEACQDGLCACVPDCAGKLCGDDGCGGVCGTCDCGFECAGGQCVTGAPCASVGKECCEDSQCGPPAHAMCFDALPAGYCAIPDCASAADCPAGTSCITLTSDSGDETYCLKDCSSNADCREGYICHPDVQICWYQPGLLGSPIGGPCLEAGDCATPNAVCYPEVYGKEPTGYVLGYCVLFSCSAGSCPADSDCFAVGSSGDSTACLPLCETDGDCRQGYGCLEGVCSPDCDSDSSCPLCYACDPAAAMCIHEDLQCSAANPMGWCPEGLYCQSGECKEFVFTCTDDKHEPNETYTKAATVEPGDFKVELEEDLQVCKDDKDWFRLDVPAGQTGTLGITFYHQVGDLDLCLYDQAGKFLGCRYPLENYPASWREYDWNDEFLSALAGAGDRTLYFKALGFGGAPNNYNLFAWTTPWKDGAVCTDLFTESECKGCLPNGQCVKDQFKAALMQFPYPDPADPYVGDGYMVEHSSSYSWARRETVMLIRHAIRQVQQKFPGTKPLGLMDMAQIDGITPGFDVGSPRHPETTHDEGGNIDVAYYQTTGDNSGKIVCDPNGGSNDGYYCTSVANHVVDLPRTAYFLAMLAASSRFRVAGMDQLIAPLVEEAIDDLVQQGAITQVQANMAKNKLAYGDGWPFHHHHIHVSLKWWSQRGHREDYPIGCGYRFPADGTWDGYLNMLALTGDHKCKRQNAKCKVQNGHASWLSATIGHRPSAFAGRFGGTSSTITYDRRSPRSCLERLAGLRRGDVGGR